MKKVITLNEGLTQVVLTSNCNFYDLKYDFVNIDSDDEEELMPFFISKGEKYYLHEFIRLSNNCSEWEKDFHGVLGTSYFTGIYIKLNKNCDAVQIWHMRQ